MSEQQNIVIVGEHPLPKAGTLGLHFGDKQVGELSEKDGRLHFEGEATESACVFLAALGIHFSQEMARLKQLEREVIKQTRLASL